LTSATSIEDPEERTMTTASRGSTRRRLRHLAGAVLVLLAVASPVLGQTTDTQRELNRAKEELEELREAHRGAEARMDDLLGRIQGLTNQVSQVTVQVEALEAAIDETRRSIRESREETEHLQAALDDRARDVYIRGPAGALDLVLASESMAELASRFNFLEVLSRSDANVAEGLSVERQLLNENRTNYREYLVEKEDLLAQLEGRQAELDALFAEQSALSAELKGAVREQEKIVENLTAKLQRELLAQYGIQGGGNIGPPVGADGPFYWCPVDPPRSYIDDFGFPRVGHTHQGNDVFAPEGTIIRAPFEGTAEEGYDGLGGIVVHVYGSANADYVYNAHLSKHLGVDGKHVMPGEPIGLVGNTGNAAGTPPHDHFEYHPGGGSAVSPYPYLNEVCGVGGGG
jgi:peptidoglycan LD-endopeptidase LytH